MKCKKCGREIGKKKFCGYCGAKRKSSKKKVFTISLIVAVLLVVIVVLLFLFNIIDIPLITPINKEAFDENNIGKVFFQKTEEEHIVKDNSGIMYVDNELLLVATADAKYADIEKLAKEYGAEIVGWIEQTGDYQLQINQSYTNKQLERIATSLKESELVQDAYINFAFETDGNKTEERNGFIYGDKWEKDLQNFNNCKGRSWGIEAVETLAAWDVLDKNKKNVKPVKVGLIDSAFDTNHEDLGFADTFYNVNNDQDHGTHVAGTIASKSNNQEGICGVYPYGDGNLYGVSYLGVCSYSENGTPFTTSMFLKISYSELILRNVKVINSSLGFNYYNWEPPLKYTDSQWNEQVEFLESNAYILGDFLDRLLDKGYDFVLINAAGNDSDRDNNIVYDSKYNFWTTVISEEDYPNVYNRIIVVGAVDSNYEICDFSNGGDRVDIYAPGDTIFSTTPDNKYENKDWSGTSMAAPHVSGVAAMVWAVNNDLTGAQVKKIVCKNHSFRCNSCDMVDAYMSVQEAARFETSKGKIKDADGGILCWVVSDDDVDTKIEKATVTVTSIKDGKTYTANTDAFGHFELFVPAGAYSLSVSAEGYEKFTWSDNSDSNVNSIVVQSNSINYLGDWIKLKLIHVVNDAFLVSPRNHTDGIPISSVEDMKTKIKNNTTDTFYLTDDIDFANKSWNQIEMFGGKIYGNGYVIKNLTLDFQECAGLFRNTENAEIYDLGFENANIDCSAISESYVGLISAFSNSDKIDNCFIIDSNIRGSNQVGAFFAYTTKTKFSNLYTNANLSMYIKTSDDFVQSDIGGITGSYGCHEISFEDVFTNCIVESDITANVDQYQYLRSGSIRIGGIVGDMNATSGSAQNPMEPEDDTHDAVNVTFNQCKFNGSIYGDGGQAWNSTTYDTGGTSYDTASLYAGGIIGYAETDYGTGSGAWSGKLSIISSSVDANIKSSSYQTACAGGVVGSLKIFNDGTAITIDNVSFNGQIETTGDPGQTEHSYAGSIAGCIWTGETTFSNITASGTITDHSNFGTNVGKLSGLNPAETKTKNVDVSKVQLKITSNAQGSWKKVSDLYNVS